MRINRLLLVVVIMFNIPIICIQVQAQTAETTAVTVPAGQQITVVLQEELYSQRNRAGDEVVFALKDDYYREGILVLPEGTPVLGKVVDVRPARSWGKAGAIEVGISSIILSDGSIAPVSDNLDFTGNSSTSGLLAGMAVADVGIGLVAGHSSDNHTTMLQPLIDGTVILGMVALNIAVGSVVKGKKIRIPAGTEMCFSTTAVLDTPIIPELAQRAQIELWWQDRIIDNFLGFSWKRDVTVEQAFNDCGYSIDASKVLVEDSDNNEKRITVDLGNGEFAVFDFAPFDDVPVAAALFKPLQAVNEPAKKILKLVK